MTGRVTTVAGASSGVFSSSFEADAGSFTGGCASISGALRFAICGAGVRDAGVASGFHTGAGFAHTFRTESELPSRGAVAEGVRCKAGRSRRLKPRESEFYVFPH